MSGAGAVSAEIHVYPHTELEVKAFEATSERGPFVLVQVGASGGRVALFVSDEEALNALVATVGEARAKLVGALTRAKRARDGQPELPELSEFAGAV